MTSERSTTSNTTPLDTLALTHGLIIRQPWLDRILEGQKTWEIRGTNTQIRGPIALIQSGLGRIVGLVHLVDVQRLSAEAFHAGVAHHTITDWAQHSLPYPTCYAWVLAHPIRLPQSIAYTHPRGAVRWVRFRPPLAVAPPSKGGFDLYGDP